MKLKGNFFTLLAILLSVLGYSQTTFYNNGSVTVMSGAVVQINGNVELNGGGLGSSFENNGDVTVSNSNMPGDFLIDNSGNSALSMGSGVYHIEGDWINDGAFVPQASEVELFGADQLITGSQNTIFNDLSLTGSGVKRQTIDAFVNGDLALNDRELATDSFTMYVMNSSTNAVTTSAVGPTGNGFVSSLAGGALWWQTGLAGSYLFPVGSSLGTQRYRPINIDLAASNTNAYGIRFVNDSANIDGFDITQVDDSICALNPVYYHEIHRTVGTTPVDLTMYYDVADGTYDAMGVWGDPQAIVWNKVGPAVASTSGSFETLTASSYNGFGNYPFILGETSPLGPAIVGLPEACKFQSAIYSLTPGDPGSTYFEWSVTGNGASIDTTMQGMDEMSVSWGGSNGTVSAIEVYPNGCRSLPSTPPLSVTVFDGPTAAFTSVANDPNLDVIEFTDNSSSAFAWEWDFGDENTSDSQHPNHEYDEIGSYTVQLVAFDENGCTDTTLQEIVVREGLELPIVFSPNDDGINDVFVGANAGLTEYKLSIYNRWGLLIFESEGNKAEWGGYSFSGEECTPGTYFYVLTATGESGDDYSRNGYVTLLR